MDDIDEVIDSLTPAQRNRLLRGEPLVPPKPRKKKAEVVELRPGRYKGALVKEPSFVPREHGTNFDKAFAIAVWTFRASMYILGAMGWAFYAIAMACITISERTTGFSFRPGGDR